jgi:amino acid adenylation domain-containing protein
MNINSAPIASPPNLLAVDFDPFAEGELLLTAPATPSQTEIWLSVQMGDAANCAYNLSQSFRLTGSLNQPALASSLQQLVHRHESLRTSFSSNGESLCIVAELLIDIPTIDLTDLPPSARDLQLARIIEQDLNQPFNIEQGPLFRAQIIKLAAQEHLLLLNAHHIICDGWSWSILIEDLGALYSAQVQGINPNLPAAEKFSDYARAEIAAAQQPDAAATEQYWLAQFADAVPVVDFPTDRPRPTFRTFNAARLDYELAGGIGNQLKQIGQKFGCSFATTILAGFEVLVHRLTGQADLVVGIPASGQIAAGQDRLVGHCTNLLPLRTQIDGNCSFIDYLHQRRSTMLDAYEHQQFTFGSLVSKLALPRDPSRIPLVPIMFNLDRAAASNSQLFSGLELASHLNPRAFETFELFINAVELADKIVLECQYNTNLFDHATIHRRMSEFETLLQGIIADPAQLIAKLPLLTAAAQQQLITEWNATQADYPDTKCLHQLVEAQVNLTPEAIAVVWGRQQLTYAELDRQANQLANYLINVGVQPATLVGICVDRSLAMIVGLLGILKTGAAYVPIDPNYPVDRIEYMLADAQIKVLVTQQPLVQHLPTQINQLVCLDSDGDQIAQAAATAPIVAITPAQIAYVIYTSGSTGKPKGVEVLHRGVVNFLTSMQHQPGIVATDIFLSVTTLSFDIAVLELFLPITVGAQVVLLSREDAMDGRKLANTIADAGITIMQATPSTWRLLLEADWAGSRQLKILSGGEAISRDLAAQLLTKSASAWNMYGPTETTIWSTVEQLAPDQRISIGRPIANTKVYILDGNLQPVPIGITGDLYIAGVGLARGYWQRPELTGDKFIADPFSNQSGTRIYQTGDLARYLPTGQIECLGRADFQVKLRGFRIELGEIEALLCQHPTIAQATAMIREDLPGDRRLVAYIVSKSPAATPPTSELRQFLQQKLPDYFLPSAMVVLPALPLTPNGKIDLKALPIPDADNFQLQTSFVAPTTSTEISLAEIWSQVLRIDKIGTGDDFFELGGHSLLATQVISRVRQAFEIDIPLQSLFEQPTIAGLASRIDTSLWFKTSSQQVPDTVVDEMEEIEI